MISADPLPVPLRHKILYQQSLHFEALSMIATLENQSETETTGNCQVESMQSSLSENFEESNSESEVTHAKSFYLFHLFFKWDIFTSIMEVCKHVYGRH